MAITKTVLRRLGMSSFLCLLILLQLLLLPHLQVVHAQATAECLIYMVDDVGAEDSVIFSMDPVTQEINILNDNLQDWNIEALEIDPVTNVIYAATADNGIGTSGRLYTVDAITGDLTLIGDTGTGGVDDLAFNPVTNELWGVRDDVAVFKIDKNTAAITQNFPGLDVGIEGMAWDPTGTILYMTNGGSSRVYVFDETHSNLARVYSDAPLPYISEGLEGLDNGYILGGTQSGSDINLYIYDPNAADQTYPNAIVESLVVSNPMFDDVEGIAWPTEGGCVELTFSPSCTIDIVVGSTLEPGTSVLVFVNADPESAIDYLEFSTSDPSLAYFDPANPVIYDPPSSFSATLITSNPGFVDIIVIARDINGEVCTPSPASVTVEIVNHPPWWQLLGGSIWADNGNLSSSIPTEGSVPYSAALIEELMIGGVQFATKGIAAATGTVNPQDNIMTANIASADKNIYKYDYFADRLKNYSTGSVSTIDTSCGDYNSSGYEICHSNGDYTLGGIDFADRKVVLLVDGDLTITGNVNITKGLGFFMAIAGGDIIVSDTVSGNSGTFPVDTSQPPGLEGLFIATDDFIILGSGSDDQLRIRGSVAAMDRGGDLIDGLDINRSLENNDQGPATVFEYAPDLIMRYPRFLTPKSVIWRESAL